MNRKELQRHIETIHKMIEAVGIIIKEPCHTEALDAAVMAMTKQKSKEKYIRMLAYQVRYEGAMIFPDPLTKTALLTAEDAMIKWQAEGGGEDAQAN